MKKNLKIHSKTSIKLLFIKLPSINLPRRKKIGGSHHHHLVKTTILLILVS